MENEFPPNSHSQREARPARKAESTTPARREVASRITKGKVTIRKKPLRRKFLEAFRPEDNKGFVEYVLIDIFAEGIKVAIADASHGIIDNAFGVTGATRSRRRGRSGGGFTSYNRMSSRRDDRDDDRHDRRGRRESSGPSHDQEIIVDSRAEAEEILDQLIELASKFDAATIRDLKSMIGEPHSYTDEDWGWSDLRGARIHRIGRDGYLLDLPRPEALD